MGRVGQRTGGLWKAGRRRFHLPHLSSGVCRGSHSPQSFRVPSSGWQNDAESFWEICVTSTAYVTSKHSVTVEVIVIGKMW